MTLNRRGCSCVKAEMEGPSKFFRHTRKCVPTPFRKGGAKHDGINQK